jgi:hypothetical protein
MSRIFEKMRTEAGMQKYQDLIAHTTRELDLTIESHGAHSIEAAGQHLILGSIRYLIGDFECAEPHIWSYVTFSQQKCGSNSAELFTGLILLSLNYIGERQSIEEIPLVFDRLKHVSQRCHEERDPLLEGLYEAAMRCQSAGDPTSQQRGFILSLMALGWCVRHQSDTQIYEQFFPRLKAVFASYGFVGDRWEWLLKHANHNLHDIVGLISLLLDKRIVPSCTEPPLSAEMREEALAVLLREFPVCAERDLRHRIAASGGQPVKLQFRCSRCGSWDLRTMFMEPYYPVSTLDSIEVNPNGIDLCVLNEREPSEFEGQGHTEGWQFWCDKCGLVPNLDVRHEDEAQEPALARWLLDNCPQDEGLPATENSRSEG